MNTKVLCITVLVFTILIFLGNHSAARNEVQSQTECVPCGCKVEVVSIFGKSKVKEPSCSVVFTLGLSGIAVSQPKVGQINASPGCDFSVFCDRTHLGKVKCGGTDAQGPVDPSQKCVFRCSDKTMTFSCDNWQRPQKGKKKSGSLWPTNLNFWTLLASTNITPSMMPGLLPTGSVLDETETDETETKETITGSNRWRLIDGEAGIEKGVLMVASGEAEAQSFCTGDKIRLFGPGIISLPKCQVDFMGHWQGAYTRRLLKKIPLAVSLDLRNESGALRGELKTPDGVFSLVSLRQSSDGFYLEAAGSVGGKERKFSLNGSLTKGEVVIDGSESPAGEKSIRLIGVLKRLHIADSGLPPAVLGQPYSYTLTGISPDAETVAFRLAAGRLPRGISFDAATGSLSGTPVDAGNFNIRVAATDTTGSSFEQPLTLTVKKMMITNRLLADAFIGRPYSAALKVAGGQPPYRFSGFAPRGLTLDANTGVISGTPTSSRHETSQFTIRDSQNNSEVVDVSLHVRTTTILNSHFLPEATQGYPYRVQFNGVGNNIATQWLMSGEDDVNLINSLGLTLNRLTGELSGTPTKPGEFRLSLAAITTSVDQQYRNFTLTINPGVQPGSRKPKD